MRIKTKYDDCPVDLLGGIDEVKDPRMKHFIEGDENHRWFEAVYLLDGVWVDGLFRGEDLIVEA
jgi:hypothetical protein